MHLNDITADTEMIFQQIISLTDLMLETNNINIPNILTLRGLAQTGYENILKID